MFVDDLVKQPGLWASDDPEAGIVVSSRVRLARNVRGYAFPGWAADDERLRLADRVRQAIAHAPSLKRMVYLDMGELAQVDKEVLKERHLISQELAALPAGSGVALLRDERIAVMVNEEDHLRMQVISPGMTLRELWSRVDRLDGELEAGLDYAFSPRLGYLTACPSNVGTGLRASVMMHLSGLCLLNELSPVVKGLEKLNLTVRGILGEGSEAQGNICQISNQTTLGETETEIVDRLAEMAGKLCALELNARGRLLEKRRTYVLLDHVSRSIGMLRHAYLLNSREAVDLLAALRLGVELEMVRGVSTSDLNEILLLTQPGHLQKMYQRELGPEERDCLRAERVRERIASVTMADEGG